MDWTLILQIVLPIIATIITGILARVTLVNERTAKALHKLDKELTVLASISADTKQDFQDHEQRLRALERKVGV